jgi:hypothetical protein
MAIGAVRRDLVVPLDFEAMVRTLAAMVGRIALVRMWRDMAVMMSGRVESGVMSDETRVGKVKEKEKEWEKKRTRAEEESEKKRVGNLRRPSPCARDDSSSDKVSNTKAFVPRRPNQAGAQILPTLLVLSAPSASVCVRTFAPP